jgi:hypothetical protein
MGRRRIINVTKIRTAGRLWWWLIPLFLVTFWLGARSLDADVIWVDEYHSLEDSGVSYFGPLSPVGIWNKVAVRNPWHAPGYFITLNSWYRLVGPEPPALRAMSLFLGVLTVAWTYRLGRELVSPRVGLYAAVVLGTSAFYAHFLHEMRVYTLLTLISVVMMWAYFRIVRSPRSPWWVWVTFGVGCAALPYLHYFATLPVVAVAVYHLFFVKKDRRWWMVVGVMALAALLFMPWFMVFLSVFQRTREFERLAPRALTAGDAVSALTYYFSNGMVVLFLVLAALALFVRSKMARALVFLAITLLVLLLLTNQVLKIMHGGRIRYLIAMWPLCSLVVALGLARLRQWQSLVASGVLVLWVGFGLWNTVVTDITAGLDGYSYVFPMHLVAREIEKYQQPDDVVVNYLPDDGLEAIQYERIASFYYTPMQLAYLVEQSPTGAAAEWAGRMAEHIELLEPRPRIWVASVPDWQPSTIADYEAALLETHLRCEPSYSREGLTLDLFVMSPEQCAR